MSPAAKPLAFSFGSPQNTVDLTTFSFGGGSGSAVGSTGGEPIDFESPQFGLGSANASFASVDGVEAALNDAALTRNLFDTSVTEEDGGAHLEEDMATKDALFALAGMGAIGAMGGDQGSSAEPAAAAAPGLSFAFDSAGPAGIDVSAIFGGGDDANDVNELITAAAAAAPGSGGGGADFSLFKEPAPPKPTAAAPGGKPRRKAKGRRKKAGSNGPESTIQAPSASEEDWSTVSESESVGGGD